MLIISFFTDKGALKSGLTPLIKIVDADADSVIINNAAMTALTTMTHCYYYNFAAYDETKNYAITVDGGAGLNNIDRYQFGTNENNTVQADVMVLKKIATGRWKIQSTQMIMYNADGITPLYTFNLKDISGNLTDRNVFERIPV